MNLNWLRIVRAWDGRSSRDERLDSWKEIAAHLKRDVRTVQRWEADEDLPVHRRLGKQRASVYAYTSELDSWWVKRKVQNGNGSSENGSDRIASLAIAKLAILLVASATAGIIVYRLATTEPSEQSSGRELNLAPLRFGKAAVSSDARWLAYTSEENLHLWVRDLKTGHSHLLVDEWIGSFAWSRDSRRIAFVGGREAPHYVGIVSVAGGERVRIAEAATVAALPTPHDWSIDNRKLLCTRASPDVSGSIEIGFLSVAERSFEAFMNVPRGTQWPRLSPDNRFVAYSSRRDGNFDLYVASSDGSRREERLTHHPDRDREPVWSPDGQHILFDRRHGSDRDNSVWAVKVDTLRDGSASKPKRISNLGYDSPFFRKSFDPEGRLLVGQHPSRTQCHLLKLDPSTGLPVGNPISDFPELSSCLHWSTSENKITYVNWILSESSPDTVEVERDVETGEERLVTSPIAAELTRREGEIPQPPKNLPAFQWRYFRKAGARFVYRSSLETGETESFYQTADPVTGVGISPNADYLHFQTKAPGRLQYRLWLMHLAEKEVRLVATTRLNPTVTWSWDGREMAFPDTNCLNVMAPNDPAPKTLTCAAAPNLPEYPSRWGPLLRRLWLVPLAATWSRDGTKLAWGIPVPENRRVELWIVDRATGEHEVALGGEHGYYTMPHAGGWSYEGQWLATSIHWYPDHEIRRLEGLLAKL